MTAQTSHSTKAPITSQAKLKALLTDPNPCISSLAIRQLLSQPKQCERFIAENQDAADLALRRCTHQLAGCLRMQQLEEKLVFLFEQGRLDAWNALTAVDQLYDQRSSARYLKEATQEFLSNYNTPGQCTLNKIAKYMKEKNFCVPQHPILNIYHYLVGDVLDNGAGVASVLCALAQLLATSRDLPTQIVLTNGKFGLVDFNNNLLDPTEKWKVTSKVSKENFHLCSNQELLRIYLTQLLASSIILWETFDTHLFLRLLLRLDGLSRNGLPYPFGNQQAPKPESE